MLKTDLDILAYINAKPDRTVVAADLKAFIGENADARLYEMKQAHLLRRDQHWNDSRPTTYTLGTKGEGVLASHEQLAQQMTEQKAEAAREKEANDAKAVLDKKKDYRHDFKVAAFTVILTLSIEHITEIINLFKDALKAVGLLR